ncbi:RabGAP/TBC, partial [Corynespora cassiicola Philippines]
EFTPPASPQPLNPHAFPPAKKGFGSLRSRHPAHLQMDTAPAPSSAPAYERAVYSPSPSSSPPPSLPSPKYPPPRQRAPSLLRHAAVSSPLREGFPRIEQSAPSPTFAPAMMRSGSGPGSAADPRAIFNPLASNPVNQSGPAWDLTDELSAPPSQPRARGMTSSTTSSVHYQPPLRTATSIPDYGPIRNPERPNLSGAYKPNRGGTNANWSHKDYYPLRHFRGEETRASFRSGWTNGSSSFMDASGTERSSMATGRSSISDHRESTYSRAPSENRDNHSEDRDTSSPETCTIPEVSEISEDDYLASVVEDVIDAYCYDEDSGDEQSTAAPARYSASPVALNSVPSGSSLPQLEVVESRDSYPSEPDERLGNLMNLPRKGSTALPTEALDLPTGPQHQSASRLSVRDHNQMREIQKDLKDLPRIPTKKSRISRQDWADIMVYTQKKGNGPTIATRMSQDSPREQMSPTVTSPMSPTADPLPEADEDDAYPRRASTSVFDRKSTLFELGKMAPSPPNKSKTTDFAGPQPAVRRGYGTPATLRTSTASIERDRYGFKKTTDKISAKEYDAWVGKYDEYVNRRRNKWISLMSKSGLPTTDPSRFPDKSEKVKRYARKGYPPEWRGAMWWFYSGAQYKMGEADMIGLYPTLLERINRGELNKDDREAIERDLDRTFPDNIHFRPDPTPNSPDGKPESEPPLISNLREVLSCFALHNPSIGYCQSLNFIAGLLLLFLKQDNERVFVLLMIITQHHLPGAHARSLANTEVNVLMMLIRDYLPKVWNSINDTDLVNSGPGSHAHPDSKFQRQPTVALSCTSWFMSIFVGVLPIETVLRVWDAFLYEGPRALYRYALAIFKLGEGEIKKYRPGDGELFMAVQNLPRRCIDPNILYDIAFVRKGFGSLSQNVIDQKRLFWREQNDRSRNGQKGGQPAATETDDESKRGLGTLRRKASRRFMRRR